MGSFLADTIYKRNILFENAQISGGSVSYTIKETQFNLNSDGEVESALGTEYQVSGEGEYQRNWAKLGAFEKALTDASISKGKATFTYSKGHNQNKLDDVSRDPIVYAMKDLIRSPKRPLQYGDDIPYQSTGDFLENNISKGVDLLGMFLELYLKKNMSTLGSEFLNMDSNNGTTIEIPMDDVEDAVAEINKSR